MAGSTSLGGALESGVSSIAIFLLLNVMGAGLAQAGVLPRTALSAGSRITALVLLPSLIFAKMGATFNADMLLESWVLLPCACLYMTIGAVVGRGISVALVPKANVQLRICFVMACAFNNASALPLVLAETLCKQDLFGADCFDKASTYIFLWGLAWHLVFWSVGYHTLQRGATLAAAGVGEGTATGSGAPDDAASSESSESARGHSPEQQPGAAAATAIVHRPGASEQAAASHSAGAGAAQPPPPAGWRATLKGLANPNLVSVVCAIVVSLIPPLQGALFDDDGALRWFGTAAQILGEGAVPMVTLIIAGTLGHSVPGLWAQVRACCANTAAELPTPRRPSNADVEAQVAHKRLSDHNSDDSDDGHPDDADGREGNESKAFAGDAVAASTVAGSLGAPPELAVTTGEVAVTVSQLECDGAAPRDNALSGNTAHSGDGGEERKAASGTAPVAGAAADTDLSSPRSNPSNSDQGVASDNAAHGDGADTVGSGARAVAASGGTAADVKEESSAMVAPPTTLAALVLTRMVLVPALCMLVAAALVNGILASDTDPTLALVVVLQCATPSANLLVVVSTHVGFTRGAEFLAASYILQYLVGIISMTAGASLAVSMASQLG